MDDGQPTLLNRRASPFDRVLKTEIFRRGELSLFLATARARAPRFGEVFSPLVFPLFFSFLFSFFVTKRESLANIQRERAREKKREKGEGKKEKGKTGERCISGVTDQLQIQSDSRLDIPQLFSFVIG